MKLCALKSVNCLQYTTLPTTFASELVYSFDVTHLLSGLYVCVVEDLAEYVEVVSRDDLLDEADDGGASHPICQEHV